MKLRFSPTSPYVRKVLLFAHETGLAAGIELVPTNVWVPETDIGTVNPLGKVPALIIDDDTVLFDSPVILDYLDHHHGGARRIPLDGKERWAVLRLQALADGMLDAAVSRLLESRRPEGERSPAWIERQRAAIIRGLDTLEAEAPHFGAVLDVGQITVLAVLGYLDFRFSHEDWRLGRPRLAAWFANAAVRPAYTATAPYDPT